MENPEKRKNEHIELASAAQMNSIRIDSRFCYEPLLSAHPDINRSKKRIEFMGHKLGSPIWISSMTGGAREAKHINANLARAAAEFGLGMGLGSCRPLLDGDASPSDFDLRSVIGDDLPFFANLGISQVEKLLKRNSIGKLNDLIETLRADGLIIHINPLQEWLQKGGDLISKIPLDTIALLLDQVNFKVIVKEVGQGFGPKSLKELMMLPLAAIDFGAFGGTNFSMLEIIRSSENEWGDLEKFAYVGNTPEEMITTIELLKTELGSRIRCSNFIISGGIKSFLDGYYYMKKMSFPAIYGQAHQLLKYARGDYQELKSYLSQQIEGLLLAENYLKIKK